VTRIGRILAVREGAIVTDCALIGGDSGGPLFDLAGRLIAVHSRIGNDVADNLHVPIDHYGTSWERMQTGEAWGYLPGFRPVLGVTGSKSAPQAIVELVAPGSPAKAAGIKPEDIIEQFGDVTITDFDSLKRAVADTMPGERVRLWVNRGGNRLRLNIEIGRAAE
jgi:S1-C subfamily serine protease